MRKEQSAMFVCYRSAISALKKVVAKTFASSSLRGEKAGSCDFY